LKKLLLPIGYFYPAENGGPAMTLYWLTKCLSKKGYNVSVITTSNGVSESIKENSWNQTDVGNVIYLKTLNPKYSLRYIMFTLSNINNYDIIIVTSIFAPSSFIFILVASILRKRIIISPRGELDELALIYKSYIKKLMMKLYHFFLDSRRVTFQVTSLMEFRHVSSVIHKKFKICIIPNYLSLPIKLDRVLYSNYILFIGRFHEKKAIDNLIYALTHSKCFMDSEFKLYLAGDYNNDYGKKILELVKKQNLDNRVCFLGEVKKNYKQELYANAYITIMPSHTENFGNVVIESLSQSTPVIASQGTPWEDLETNNIGKWVKNNPFDLARAIDYFIKMKKSDYILTRKRCRAFIENEYDIEFGVYKWINLFEDIYKA
jgi:glycosyltransferase involved in cell wall biosynthesis